MIYTLRKGDRGQEVKRLQSKLKILDDGVFGKDTDAAVQVYQNSNGLLVDGLAGPKTLGSLGIEVLPGIDVSAWNGNVDWASVKSGGVKYCWVKITEGQTHTNKPYKRNIQGCHDNNIVVGGYHFGRPDTGIENGLKKDAIAEAQHFLSKLQPLLKPGDLTPVLDVEAGMKTDDQHNVDWSLAWLEYVESELGVKPMVYTARWAVQLFLMKASKSSLQELSRYPVWWASYNEGVEAERKPTKIWSEWDVWQWTGKGTVQGIKGRCDQNWLAGGKLNSLLIP
tara:strand:+ start:1457 stop:2299 length:843 start_codon:yes stop_codon:yes gene_type:complete